MSTPLKPLHDQYTDSLRYERPDRALNLDDYKGCGLDTIWASTPAVLWTAKRPQELGFTCTFMTGLPALSMTHLATSSSMEICSIVLI